MRNRFPNEDLDPLKELMHVLDFNGIRYRKDGGDIRFAFCDGGREWETIGRAVPEILLLYGVYPFHARDQGRLLWALSEINAQLVNGGTFLLEGRPVIRTEAALWDAYGAEEAVNRALEYNAGAMTRFWQALREAAEHNEVYPK